MDVLHNRKTKTGLKATGSKEGGASSYQSRDRTVSFLSFPHLTYVSQISVFYSDQILFDSETVICMLQNVIHSV